MLFASGSPGAQGVVPGTVLIQTHESFATAYNKQCIVDTAERDIALKDIFHINRSTRAQVRVLHNSIKRDYYIAL
ncbi:hypothetical protein [Paraburkholderia ginsengiterrae]|uniref:hypothetical protein n=1 Tax=Paraburkholderia ginsengiterrae TaxID=1462993 RepID=UPI001041BE6C|nr:hypothetical protein [Paraburkholderia ginsengiterrae]